MDVDEVAFNGTVDGSKQSFTKTGIGQGEASWSGLWVEGDTTTIYTEANDSVRYNATTTSYFKRNSTSLSYDYLANETGTCWNTTFQTQAVGDEYNFTAGYHPGWTNVKVYRNGTDVTGLVTIDNGTITVPSGEAAGNYTWEITCESPNRVSSFGFDQGLYYRGQTFATSRTIDMENLQTELVTYYDPSGVQRGATIGDNFPLGTYTAVYWCENGTDAGYAVDTVLVTDNGSINVKLSDALSRDVPGVLVNITELDITGTTNVLGQATFTEVPFGNYTIEFTDQAKGDLGSTPVEVNGSGIAVNYQSASRYLFDATFTMVIEDAFGNGFPATVVVRNATNAIVVDQVASGTGALPVTLKETASGEAYRASIYYPNGTLVRSENFTVLLGNTTYTIVAPIDAYPSLHATSVEVTVSDDAGRVLPGVNVTIENDDGLAWKLTGSGGTALFSSVYWGNDTAFDITWIAPNGTTLDTMPVTINSRSPVVIDHHLSYNYTFTAIPVTVQVVDKFGDGYGARIVIDNGSVVYNGTAGASGFASLQLDEGHYDVEIRYPDSTVLNGSTITVIKDVSTSFSYTTRVDAYPVKHVTSFSTTVKDALDRLLDGINVTVTTVDGNQSAITTTSGSASFTVYWGNSSSVNVTWIAWNGTAIHAEQYAITSTAAIVEPVSLGYMYVYPGIAVDFLVIDRFGDGFPAEIILSNGTSVANCTENGLGLATLDEGNYTVSAVYELATVETASIEVLRDQTAFTINATSFDSNPIARTREVTVSLEDASGRKVYGVDATVDTAGGTINAGTTDQFGNVTFSYYWGNDSRFNVTWSNGSTLHVEQVNPVLNGTNRLHVTATMSITYTFTGLPVEFTFLDMFGQGFKVNVEIIGVENGTSSIGGYYSTTLDEGTYWMNITDPVTGEVLDVPDFTVILDQNQSFVGNLHDHDAYPGLRVATLVTHVEDVAGRDVHPVQVSVVGTRDNGTATTNPSGNASFSLYYREGDTFTITWTDGTVLDVVSGFFMNESITYYLNHSLATKHVFKDLPVAFNVTDKDGDAYPATLSFYKDGTTFVTSGGASVDGYFQTLLDEGNYTVKVEHRSAFVENKTITVALENHTSINWINTTSYNSKVQIAALKINVKDVLGRDVFPVRVVINGSGINNISQFQLTDGGGNVLFPSLPYHQYPDYTVDVYFDDIGTWHVGSFNVTINQDVQQYNYTAPVQFLFPDILATITVTDFFGIGFRANVTIRDATNTTMIATSILTESGQRVFDLDEGNYTANVYHGGAYITSKFITVLKGNAAFSINTSIDAYPETHTSPVTITVKDVLDRPIQGLNVNITSNYTTYQLVTDQNGKVNFLSVYWGFDTWFNVTATDSSGMIDSFQHEVNQTTVVTRTLAQQYIHEDVPVTIQVLDEKGRGYIARIVIRDGNGTVVFDGETSSNGIASVLLDEGNYSMNVHFNGTVFASGMFEVREDVQTSFSYDTPVDAYPPVFEIPDWFWWALVPAAAFIAIISMIAYKHVHEKKEARRKEWASKKRYLENIAGTRLVMAYNANGIELVSKAYQTDLKDKSTLAAGLFNAVESFGKELDAESRAAKSFHYDKFSGHVFKGTYITVAVMCTTEIAGIYSSNVMKFIKAYEQKHENRLKHFVGNVGPFEEDFGRMYGEYVGTELLEPCFWQLKEINQMAINPAVRSLLDNVINKRHVKHPTIVDVLDVLATRDKSPSDTFYDGLYEVYIQGFVYPARLSSMKTFISTMFGSMERVSPEELKEFQDAKRVKMMEVGKAIDAIDKAIEEGQVMVNEGMITREQYNVLLGSKKTDQDALEKSLSAIEKYTYQQWKDASKKIVLSTGTTGAPSKE